MFNRQSLSRTKSNFFPRLELSPRFPTDKFAARRANSGIGINLLNQSKVVCIAYADYGPGQRTFAQLINRARYDRKSQLSVKEIKRIIVWLAAVMGWNKHRGGVGPLPRAKFLRDLLSI